MTGVGEGHKRMIEMMSEVKKGAQDNVMHSRGV